MYSHERLFMLRARSSFDFYCCTQKKTSLKVRFFCLCAARIATTWLIGVLFVVNTASQQRLRGRQTRKFTFVCMFVDLVLKKQCEVRLLVSGHALLFYARLWQNITASVASNTKISFCDKNRHLLRQMNRKKHVYRFVQLIIAASDGFFSKVLNRNLRRDVWQTKPQEKNSLKGSKQHWKVLAVL